MEVVLQWIDEIDDLVFSGIALWRRIRRCCLLVAMVAAVSLHILPGSGASLESVMPLFDLALIAIAAWILLVTVAIRAESSWRAVAPRA